MTVKAILDEKGRRVVTIDPSEKVQAAASTLFTNRIGAIVIATEDNRIAGILSERDIVSAIAREGEICLNKPVSDIMITNVYTCTEEMTVENIMEIMNEKRVRHLPVARNGQLTGMVSIGDAVRNHIRMIEREAEEIKAYIAG